ncbi:MAG TPA: hypothetical protein PKC29_12550 [Thermodesulfobacteriota bacterium]|nr:hypothetical protein [Thermodesulfobacteriota bacterium]
MKRLIIYTLLVLGLLQAYARADEQAPAEGGTVAEAVESEMPVLKGDTWMVMDEDAKIAFIWGAGHVVVIEEVLMEKYPDQKRDTFVTKVVEASNASPATMAQVAAAIDKFYAENPDKMDVPVMAVIWETMVKPNIAAGIAGQPLD